jgi:hypothetical protein
MVRLCYNGVRLRYSWLASFKNGLSCNRTDLKAGYQLLRENKIILISSIFINVNRYANKTTTFHINEYNQIYRYIYSRNRSESTNIQPS